MRRAFGTRGGFLTGLFAVPIRYRIRYESATTCRYKKEYDFGKRVLRLLLTSPCSCVPIILVV